MYMNTVKDNMYSWSNNDEKKTIASPLNLTILHFYLPLENSVVDYYHFWSEASLTRKREI